MRLDHLARSIVQCSNEANRQTYTKSADDGRVPKRISGYVARQLCPLHYFSEGLAQLSRKPSPALMSFPLEPSRSAIAPPLEQQLVATPSGNGGPQFSDNVVAYGDGGVASGLPSAALSGDRNHQAPSIELQVGANASSDLGEARARGGECNDDAREVAAPSPLCVNLPSRNNKPAHVSVWQDHVRPDSDHRPLMRRNGKSLADLNREAIRQLALMYSPSLVQRRPKIVHNPLQCRSGSALCARTFAPFTEITSLE
ncbi:hypothetical protein ACQKLX_03910 [Bosea sp. NPDC003192]|uniref:hypothetical protein n=1 Tax=Bosea sp. NPDC003192 TaxID=3390551 RepID=UPI003D07DB2B